RGLREALSVLHDVLALEDAAETDEEQAELHAAGRTEHRCTHGVDLVRRLGLDLDEEVVLAAEVVEQPLEHAPHRLGLALVAELCEGLADLEAGVGVEAHGVAAPAHRCEGGLVTVEPVLGGPRVPAATSAGPSMYVMRVG